MPVSQPIAELPPAGPGTASHPVEAAAAAPARNPELQRILGLSVPLSVILAQREMSIESILTFTVGTIVEFNVPFDSPLSVYIANRPIAHGEAVKVGENFGVRINQIDSVQERIDAIAKA